MRLLLSSKTLLFLLFLADRDLDATVVDLLETFDVNGKISKVLGGVGQGAAVDEVTLARDSIFVSCLLSHRGNFLPWVSSMIAKALSTGDIEGEITSTFENSVGLSSLSRSAFRSESPLCRSRMCPRPVDLLRE